MDDAGQAVAWAVRRIVQEALTNVVRHASASCVRVELSYGDGMEVVVVDDGVTATAAGSGRGLDGMRDRAARLGGTCEAGPGPSGGWRVAARFPEAA
ncbi:ATP-binding protein [Actinomadura rupiterrae]|uniref:ATP-binding protein n=1 Tax=Actinomadura rupiterrae TaxID=559627 RepID=UPI0020A51218|nr:ATP-binding protein [Actinomadura rupiterrae]MCP2338742.1 signal transduction histidine kinase [Actinomadura rupiterrae]